MKNKLKPCPFCGSNNVIKIDIVQCFDCLTMAQDEKLWNMRVKDKRENKKYDRQADADIITVRYGKWIETGDYITTAYGSVFTYRCSECKAEIIIDEYDSYCPNCGAKMNV